MPINSVARYSISGIKDVGHAIDFVLMQIGNSPLGVGPGQGQVVSEVDWNFVNTIAFTQPQSGSSFRTIAGNYDLNNNLKPVVPQLGATKFGGPPTSTPVPNRNADANDFFTTSSNWKATTSMPPAFTTPIILPTQ